MGRTICHVWAEDGKLVLYNGRIIKIKASKSVYKVGYWAQDEDYSDATDYDMSVYALAADFLYDDLNLSE